MAENAEGIDPSAELLAWLTDMKRQLKTGDVLRVYQRVCQMVVALEERRELLGSSMSTNTLPQEKEKRTMTYKPLGAVGDRL